jgi:hypothetical protein
LKYGGSPISSVPTDTPNSYTTYPDGLAYCDVLDKNNNQSGGWAATSISVSGSTYSTTYTTSLPTNYSVRSKQYIMVPIDGTSPQQFARVFLPYGV